jgi:hypothetical protein
VRSRGRTWASIAAAAAGLGGLTAAGAPAAASPIDEPAAPELACFDTPGPALGLELRLTQLDPALVQLGATPHGAVVRELVQTCVAVRRRGGPEPIDAPAVPPVDLACYRIDAAPLAEPAPLAVVYRDPMLALLPGHTATLVRPAALCLPVVRDGAVPPPDVRRLIQAIALECYAAEPGERRQICLPVAKNSERIPRDVLGVVRRIGVEKRSASRSEAVPAPPGEPGTRVVLRHLNPLLATLPAVPVVLDQASDLMVPVARRAAP